MPGDRAGSGAMTDPLVLRKSTGRNETFVIVGAGQAAAQAASTLRDRAFKGRIVMLGEERHVPYLRPPLSKSVLAGSFAEDRLPLRPSRYYEGAGIDLRLGVRVEDVDRASARVHLSDGERLPYDKLLLATGARPRSLALPGAGLGGVHSLRTVEDALALRRSLVPGVRIAIVGGGYIGLEVAATASMAGARVTVLELGDRVLARVTTAAMSHFFSQAHRERGVEIRCGAKVAAFEGGETVSGIVCAEAGAPLAADLVLLGIGAEPNVELARNAGLACDDGILVDDRCRTSDPDIFAAGDCTRHPSRFLGRRIRLESVQNAVDQATVAAMNMAGGEVRYAKVPWFWSQQYEFRFQSVGMPGVCDEMEERGCREAGAFAIVYRSKGRTIGCDAVNMPREYLSVRRQLEAELESAVPEQPRRGRRAAA